MTLKQTDMPKSFTEKNAAMTESVTELNREVVQKMKTVSWVQAESAQSQRGMQPTLERETTLGNKALTMVRRAALQDLLKQEQQQYAMELALIGKAFYKQRI
ncbi:cilia- and flagella-associated protein 141-like [Conger conger]|uniref:cilia- and flagella-associated protein 141-like n=1 Tax=Conger conger TaxID=82655 RepID=UPI002A59A1E0|nr:cilia- and flagella-associated protein 141-like [Conger conger]